MLEATSIVDLLAEYPELAVALGLLLRAGLAWQSELSWYEYRTLHGLKRVAFPTLERLVPGNLFVNTKGGRDDAEYLTTVDASIRETVRDLRSNGGTLHLISSLKRRPPEHGDPLTRAHVVWTDGGEQTEAYCFANADGTTELYAHAEASVTDPVGHLTGPQTDGDPDGVVAAALAE